MQSIVEYWLMEDPPPTPCGYCKQTDDGFTEGVWAHKMTCQDFQDLVDRGCQRSGKYVYRAVMDRCCCPQYVLRMEVADFRANKVQRKAAKRFNNYLLNGRVGKPSSDTKTVQQSTDKQGAASSSSVHGSKEVNMDTNVELPSSKPGSKGDMGTSTSDIPATHTAPAISKRVKPGTGPDPSKPPARKAKVIRLERKAQKKEKRQSSGADHDANKPSPQTKDVVGQSSTHDTCTPSPSLEELLALPDPQKCIHRFETRLVCTSPPSPEFKATFEESYAVFKKFQMQIHKEVEEKCSRKHFEEFLVQSPLKLEESCPGMPCKYGSFHQQYLIDGKIFAVGLLDIVTRGIVCEYLYYDPAYKFLAPGVYTALREVAFTRELCRINPDMQYYCMGFYVHSCPKMNYKKQYGASYLLCPESFHYVPIEKCLPKLDEAKYSKLSEEAVGDEADGPVAGGGARGEGEEEAPDGEQFNDIPVFHNMQPMAYSECRLTTGDHLDPAMESYVKFVGLPLASRMRVVPGIAPF